MCLFIHGTPLSVIVYHIFFFCLCPFLFPLSSWWCVRYCISQHISHYEEINLVYVNGYSFRPVSHFAHTIFLSSFYFLYVLHSLSPSTPHSLWAFYHTLNLYINKKFMWIMWLDFWSAWFRVLVFFYSSAIFYYMVGLQLYRVTKIIYYTRRIKKGKKINKLREGKTGKWKWVTHE